MNTHPAVFGSIGCNCATKEQHERSRKEQMSNVMIERTPVYIHVIDATMMRDVLDSLMGPNGNPVEFHIVIGGV